MRLSDWRIFMIAAHWQPDEWLNGQGCRMIVCEKHAAVYRQFENKVYVYHAADIQMEYTKLFY